METMEKKSMTQVSDSFSLSFLLTRASPQLNTALLDGQLLDVMEGLQITTEEAKQALRANDYDKEKARAWVKKQKTQKDVPQKVSWPFPTNPYCAFCSTCAMS